MGRTTYEPPPRSGAAHATIYPYGPFPAGDGGTVTKPGVGAGVAGGELQNPVVAALGVAGASAGGIDLLAAPR